MMDSPNVELLIRVAEALGDIRHRVVFIGGCATALLITDNAAAPVRVTEDVDAIVAVVSLAEYQQLGNELQKRGFTQTVEQGEPPFRWTIAGLKFDIMPIDERVLGFGNRWYAEAMRNAVTISLREELDIRFVTSSHYIATKLEAFLDRGNSDFFESHDLEDVLSVVDGRPELVEELAQVDSELRNYVAGVFTQLISNDNFLNALPGLILEGSPAIRSPVVLERLQTIAGMLQGSRK